MPGWGDQHAAGSKTGVRTGKNIVSASVSLADGEIIGHTHLTELPTQLVVGYPAFYRKDGSTGEIEAVLMQTVRGAPRVPLNVDDALKHITSDAFVEVVRVSDVNQIGEGVQGDKLKMIALSAPAASSRNISVKSASQSLSNPCACGLPTRTNRTHRRSRQCLQLTYVSTCR